jgi:hypothetical protein
MEISVRIEFNKDQKQFDMTPLREIRLDATQEFAVHSFFKAAGAHDAYEKLSTFRQTRFLATVASALGVLLLIFAIVSATLARTPSVRNAMESRNNLTANGGSSEWHILPAQEEGERVEEASIHSSLPSNASEEPADAHTSPNLGSQEASFIRNRRMQGNQNQQPPPNSPPSNQTQNTSQPKSTTSNATYNASNNGSYYTNYSGGSYYNASNGSYYNSTDGSFYNSTDGSYYNASDGSYYNAKTGAFWNPANEAYGYNSTSQNNLKLYYNMSLITAMCGALFVVSIFVVCLRESSRRTAFIQLNRFEAAEMEFLKSTAGGHFDIRPDHRPRNCFGCNCCVAFDFGFEVTAIGLAAPMPVHTPPAMVVRTDNGALYQPDPAGQTPMLTGHFASPDNAGMYWKDV